jgi:hypothetical protein
MVVEPALAWLLDQAGKCAKGAGKCCSQRGSE